MAQANADNPDLLISLYDGPGCIGTMRGRTSLGITTPVLGGELVCRDRSDRTGR